MPKRPPYRWARPGDVNAFFGLLLDNIANLLLLVVLLSLRFGFPADFIITRMVPGTALGVLVGDLAFFYLAFRLAKTTRRDDVTAMPLGIDTPSLFGMAFFILGPSFLVGREVLGLDPIAAATRTWHIGIWCLVLSGVLKLACAMVSGWIRRVVPRAGLLGSLAAIALVLISFMPILDIFAHPLPGMLALVIVLTTLIGRIPFPGRLPGTVGALVVAGGVYYLMVALGIDGYHAPTKPDVIWFPSGWLDAWNFGWLASFPDALPYLPIAFPFALMTVVGGIDCTESAAAAGDDYDTRTVIAVEGVATLIAGMSGGVIQTTPYIGHPAYKAMGGRAAYSLATALVVGTAGVVGYFTYLNAYLPPAIVFPILVFIGLEITAQSFFATPSRHYAAVALGCVPALAFLSLAFPNQIFGDPNSFAAGLNPSTLGDSVLKEKLATLTMLSNGFILTSLLWAWSLASIIDRKLPLAAIVLCVAGGLTLFGFIHSPLAENRLFLPLGPTSWGDLVLPAIYRSMTLEYATGYFASAALLAIWPRLMRIQPHPETTELESHLAGLPLPRTLEPEVMESFDEANDYDQMDHSEVNRRFVDDLLAGGPIGTDLVDLGTGTALIPIELCARVDTARVLAIDASTEMLDLARRRVEIAGVSDRIQLAHSDVKRLDEFREPLADTVMSNSLVHHLAEPRLALEAAKRLLRPGGRLFVRDLMRPATSQQVDQLVNAHASLESESARAMFRASLHAALTLEEARELATELGFDATAVRPSSDRHWTLDARTS